MSPVTQGLYMARQSSDGADTIREYMMTFGVFNAELRAAVEELSGLARTVSQAAQEAGAETSGGSGGGTVQRGPGGRPTGHIAVPAQSSTPQAPGRHMAAQADSESDQLSEGAAPTYDRHMSMGEASRGLARQISESLGRRSPQFNLDPSTGAPRLEDLGDGSRGYKVYDSDGNVMRSIPYDDADHGLGAAEEVAKQRGRASHMATAAGVAGRYGAGEGISGSLGAGAAKVAGIAGAVLMVGQKAISFGTNQYAEGGQYRQIYGEDAGKFALSQRAGAQEAGLSSYFNMMGRQRGIEAYQSASAMGLTGDQRNSAMDFDQEQFGRYGMSVQQSMKFVEMNAENSTISLQSLSDQIDKVGKSAVGAGRNAQEAIDTFGAVATQLQSTVTQGQGSVAIASGVTTALQTALPKNLSNSEDIQAFTGLLNQQNVLQYSALSGQDPRTVMNQLALDPTGRAAGQVMGGSQDQMLSIICQTAGTTPEAMRADIAKRFPGITSLTEQQQLAVLASYPDINPYTLGNIYQAFGFQVKPAQYIPMFFQILMKNTSGVGEIGLNFSQRAMKAMGASDAAIDAVGAPSSSPAGTKALGASGQQASPTKSGAFDKVSASAAKYISGPDLYSDYLHKSGALSGLSYPDLASNDIAGSAMAYARSEATTGSRNTAVEGLLASGKQFKSDTGTGVDEAKFRTSKGDKTLIQILADPELLAALSKGQINAVGAGNTAIDINKYTGIASDSVQGTSTDPSSSGGQVLALTPLAQKFFHLTGPSDSQRAGTPALGLVVPSQW